MPWSYPFSKRWLEAKIATYGTPIFVVNLKALEEQFLKFKAFLPGVEVFYAMKSLGTPPVIERLAKLGCNFDVASVNEARYALARVPSSRIFLTHPYKPEKVMKFSKQSGLSRVVFDNLSELKKIAIHANFYKPFLRISIPNPDSVVKMHLKFGAAFDECESLLDTAKEMGVRVYGLSFHIGSQSKSNNPYSRAIEFCADLIEREKAKGFHNIQVINLGGGYPIRYANHEITREEEVAYFEKVRESIQPLQKKGVKFYAEPGRYISGPCGYSIASVISRSKREHKPAYYIDDGVYGLYSGVIYDHAQYFMTPFRMKEGKIALIESEEPTHESLVFGATCDSIDAVEREISLPELDVKDLIIGSQMGAYTYVSSSDSFNGINRANVVYWDGETE